MVDDNPAAYPEEMLLDWKTSHEARVSNLLRLGLGAKGTFAIHVRARFGSGEGRVIDASPEAMLDAVLQTGRMFESPDGHLRIDADPFRRDDDGEYWGAAEHELAARLNQWLGEPGGLAKVPHITVFASGPIPLLISLGRLLGDTRPIDVRDFDRDSASWLWPEVDSKPPHFRVTSPRSRKAAAIKIVVELSGRTDRSAQLTATGGKDLPEVLVDVEIPRPGLIRGPKYLPGLRRAFQSAFEMAKAVVGDNGHIHVFGAMPLSAAVAFGQAQLPKAMPNVHVYDNSGTAGGWRHALTFSRK